MKQKSRQEGFTIIEILVSVALLAVIGLMMNVILLNSMRAILKSQSVKEVKQTGDFAMSTILQRLRNATAITPCVAGAGNVIIQNPDGSSTTFSVVEQPPGSGVRKILADTNGSIQAMTTSNDVTVNTMNSLLFSCNSSTGKVSVSFTLDHVHTENLPFEERASIPYTSTVILRNW